MEKNRQRLDSFRARSTVTRRDSPESWLASVRKVVATRRRDAGDAGPPMNDRTGLDFQDRCRDIPFEDAGRRQGDSTACPDRAAGFARELDALGLYLGLDPTGRSDREPAEDGDLAGDRPPDHDAAAPLQGAANPRVGPDDRAATDCGADHRP